jgi:hypothetical protein
MTTATSLTSAMRLALEAAHARVLTDSSQLPEERVLTILAGICIDAKQTPKSLSPQLVAMRNLALLYRDMRRTNRIQSIPTISKLKLLDALSKTLRLN